MAIILWFKRDLRVEDNAALAAAAESGAPVIPLYIVEPEMWAAEDASARQWRFICECLEGLDASLTRLGSPLVIRVGEAVAVLESLRLEHKATTLISHEEIGVGWSFERDKRVAAWAKAQGVRWDELPTGGVVRRLNTRDRWARSRDELMAQPQVAPKALTGLSVASDPLPDARALNLPWDTCPDRQKGGRAQGLSLLGSFLIERGETYRSDMSSPLEGATACSRLSPHLAWGTLSNREAVHAAAARREEVAGQKLWAGSIKSFTSRLAWRDHFMQKLEDAPDLAEHCLHSAYEGLRPKEADAARLTAWATGQTGLPFVDACMRSLNATGWLNFRMRSMVVAVASYHLWLDWRATGPVLARLFTDYEPGIHWSQMQMQSGTTGINTLRIYNPIKQGHDQDPTGAFTRAWIPELAAVPDAFLQEPWKWPGAHGLLGKRYPVPIVNVPQAAKAAREKVWAVRQSEAFYREADRIVIKHASRKDRARRFVRDKIPRAKPSQQMSFDL